MGKPTISMAMFNGYVKLLEVLLLLAQNSTDVKGQVHPYHRAAEMGPYVVVDFCKRI